MPWSDLYHYWRSKHVDGRPPSRGEIDPFVEIPSLLANIMLIDIEPAGYRNRLIGSSITHRVGRDSTGKRIDHELFGPTILAIWLEIMGEVSNTQHPRLVAVHIASREKASMLTLILPLVGRSGRTEMIFSGCFFDRILAPPRRPLPLEPIKVIVPDGEANG